MALLDFLNTSLLVNIGTLILLFVLVGGLYAYFSSKLSAQDHKISSMVSCVSTMAEEIQSFRKHINEQFVANKNPDALHLQSHVLNRGGEILPSNLIQVSDDEDSEEENDDDYEDETDASSDDDSVSDSNSDSNSESDTDNEDAVSENNDILDSNLNGNNILKLVELPLTEETSDYDNIKTIHIDENNENNEDAVSISGFELDDSIDLTKLPIPHIKQEPIETSIEENIFNKDDIKSISLIDEHENNDSHDYKKMSLTKLREIVVKKKLASDASKMKKNEILKMLGVE